jgi:hypothetical protein
VICIVFCILYSAKRLKSKHSCARGPIVRNERWAGEPGLWPATQKCICVGNPSACEEGKGPFLSHCEMLFVVLQGFDLRIIQFTIGSVKNLNHILCQCAINEIFNVFRPFTPILCC